MSVIADLGLVKKHSLTIQVKLKKYRKAKSSMLF